MHLLLKYLANPHCAVACIIYLDLTDFLEEFFVIRFLVEMNGSGPDGAGEPLRIGHEGRDAWRPEGLRMGIRKTAQPVVIETTTKL